MRGSCLCNKVQYETLGTQRQVVACHCHQCRKTSGHFVAATQVEEDKLEIHGSAYLTWYQSSETAKRAFCSICGSQLFWKEFGSEKMSVMAGSIEGDSGLEIVEQIHVSSKGDYYDLPALTARYAGS